MQRWLVALAMHKQAAARRTHTYANKSVTDTQSQSLSHHQHTTCLGQP